MAVTDRISEQLNALQDTDYRDFQSKLLPTVEAGSMIGVRTPALRKMAKELAKDPEIGDFLRDLPHRLFEENQLHAFIVSGTKDFETCMEQTERFLPYIDNWATCDQFSPAVFKKHREKLMPYIREWIRSGKTYTVRFGIGMLMQHYLDEDFDPEYPELAAGAGSEEYYVNMMIAWYFATALAKQYDAVIPYIEQQRLPVWTHNKTIQKAVESFRITPERKEHLRTLRIKAQ